MQKVIISDEVVEHTIDLATLKNAQSNPDCDYPFALLSNGQKFYFNRVLFL